MTRRGVEQFISCSACSVNMMSMARASLAEESKREDPTGGDEIGLAAGQLTA